MIQRHGPHRRALAQAIHDGARLYRVAAGWYTEHQGRRTKQDRERCMGMVVRGLLMIDGTDALSNGESRDRYVLSEACKRALEEGDAHLP